MNAKPKILIIDDQPDNIHVLIGLLKDSYTLVAAGDGRQALQLLEKRPLPDLILLDIMMPEMNGYEVCEHLKADPLTRDIPVIFVTAMNDDQDEARGLALGAVDYVLKPFKPELLKARIRNHLELKAHRDKLEELVAERTDELLLTRDVTIQTMAVLAETRDNETGGHIQRTQHYVRVLAEHLRNTNPEYRTLLSDGYIDLLFKSAPLHDIGKIGVPDAILLKPGRLTSEEFQEMKKHTEYGRNAIIQAESMLGSDNSFLSLAREVAYSHHEKWDGSGYPLGLSGRDIPLSGRLMALADVFDALISKRVYKPPFPLPRVKSIIVEGRGAHFDPELVDAFMAEAEMFRRIGITYADTDEERQSLEQGYGEQA
jgi:putative two-component system response regulator